MRYENRPKMYVWFAVVAMGWNLGSIFDSPARRNKTDSKKILFYKDSIKLAKNYKYTIIDP